MTTEKTAVATTIAPDILDRACVQARALGRALTLDEAADIDAAHPHAVRDAAWAAMGAAIPDDAFHSDACAARPYAPCAC